MTDQGSRAVLRGHCPNCDADRNAEVLAEDTLEEEDKASGIWGRSTYSILRCLGCDRRYIRLVQECSEDTTVEVDPETGEPSWAINEQVTYWPSPPRARRRRPAWLGFASDYPELSLGFASDYPELATLLGELYTALDLTVSENELRDAAGTLRRVREALLAAQLRRIRGGVQERNIK